MSTKVNQRDAAAEEYRDIPEHEHTHSLYVRCLDCQTFGINMPTRFIDAAECGNCKSINTVKYYPSCCILSDRQWAITHDPAVLGLVEALEQIQFEINDDGVLTALNIATEALEAYEKERGEK